MTALLRLRRTVLFGVAGAVLMAILLPGLALIRDTTGHDWYAAGKLVVTDAMIRAGFDPWATTDYRAADGSIRQVTRLRFTYTVEAWQARSHILSTITDNALLGAGAGFAGTVIVAILSRAANGRQRERVSRVGVGPTQREQRPSSHRGSGNIDVLSQTESGTSVALLVAPAEMDRPAGALGQARGAPLLPAAESERDSMKNVSTPLMSDAAPSGREADAESADEPKPDLGETRQSPEDSAESSCKPASGRDGDSAAKACPKRRESDDDGNWF